MGFPWLQQPSVHMKPQTRQSSMGAMSANDLTSLLVCLYPKHEHEGFLLRKQRRLTVIGANGRARFTSHVAIVSSREIIIRADLVVEPRI